MRVEIDSEKNTISLDGIGVDLDVLKCITNPNNPEVIYKLVRQGKIVRASSITAVN